MQKDYPGASADRPSGPSHRRLLSTHSRGMTKTGWHSSMPFPGMNPEEKLREGIPHELNSGRLTFP